MISLHFYTLLKEAPQSQSWPLEYLKLLGFLSYLCSLDPLPPCLLIPVNQNNPEGPFSYVALHCLFCWGNGADISMSWWNWKLKHMQRIMNLLRGMTSKLVWTMWILWCRRNMRVSNLLPIPPDNVTVTDNVIPWAGSKHYSWEDFWKLEKKKNLSLYLSQKATVVYCFQNTRQLL